MARQAAKKTSTLVGGRGLDAGEKDFNFGTWEGLDVTFGL
jgi:hypothetical protein